MMFTVFFFNDTATTEIYTLSLHDALPISGDPDQMEQELEVLAARLSEPMDDDEMTEVLEAYNAGLARLDEYLARSEEHTSELQSQSNLVCRLLLEKKKKQQKEKTYQKSTL